MKYYTREWYGLMQDWGLKDNYKKIPDGNYTDEQIQALYDKKLKREIAKDKKEYNSEPVFFQMDFDDLTLDDCMIVDEKTGNVRKPESIEEVKESYQREYEETIEEFNSREPFDSQYTVETFEDIYKNNLKTLFINLPQYVLDGVDHRLLALDYMTDTIYTQYKQEMKDKKKQWNSINKKAERVLAKQDVSEYIHEALALHDASLLSLKKKGKNLVMEIRLDELSLEDETPYRKVIFKDVEILEKDDLRGRKHLEYGYYISNIYYLCHEIYSIETGYEVHIMFAKYDTLPYLTLKCKDITYEDNVEL